MRDSLALLTEAVERATDIFQRPICVEVEDGVLLLAVKWSGDVSEARERLAKYDSWYVHYADRIPNLHIDYVSPAAWE